MSNERAEGLKNFPFPLRLFRGNGLEHRLLRRHCAITSISILLRFMGLIFTLVFRSSVVRLAHQRAPTARTSMLDLSGTNRSLEGLRGWGVLGEPQFLDDLTDAWQNDIHPAVSRLDESSRVGTAHQPM